MKECLRCGVMSPVSAIGETLFHFVCDYCRNDMNEWYFTTRRGIAVTINDMERDLTA